MSSFIYKMIVALKSFLFYSYYPRCKLYIAKFWVISLVLNNSKNRMTYIVVPRKEAMCTGVCDSSILGCSWGLQWGIIWSYCLRGDINWDKYTSHRLFSVMGFGNPTNSNITVLSLKHWNKSPSFLSYSTSEK